LQNIHKPHYEWGNTVRNTTFIKSHFLSTNYNHIRAPKMQREGTHLSSQEQTHRKYKMCFNCIVGIGLICTFMAWFEFHPMNFSIAFDFTNFKVTEFSWHRVWMWVFRNIAPCSRVEKHWRFRNVYCLHHQDVLMMQASHNLKN
jgi:hypothetical protein